MTAPFDSRAGGARRLLLLGLCAVVILAAIAGLVWGLLTASQPISDGPGPTDNAQSEDPSTSPSTDTPDPPTGSAVDPTVVDRGLIPQPVTGDLLKYAKAAARAVATVDARKVDRYGFLDYLTTWIGADPRIEVREDREAEVQATRKELAQFVIGDDARWADLAASKTVITAKAVGTPRVDYDHVNSFNNQGLDNLIALGIHIVTVDLSVTVAENAGERVSYEYPLTMSMQIVCGSSAPLSNTTQSAEDCTVLRWFDEPMS